MDRSARDVAAILIGVFLAACSRSRPDADYHHTLATYLSGDLPRAVEQAARNAARWRKHPDSPWFWGFRLLQAEALTAQSRNQEAATLLKDAPPSGPEWSQV